MRWRWVILALVVGGLAAAWWFIMQWHQENRQTEVPQQTEGQIGLMVQHQGPELLLHWNTDQPEVRNAHGGTLTITDGQHESTLNLDGSELRTGVAFYWPQAGHVTFNLETDGGAWGSLQVPAWEVQPARQEQAKEQHKPEHRLEAGKQKAQNNEAARADDPPAHTDRAKTHKAKAKSSSRNSPKIPSSWKDPRRHARD